MRKIAHEEKERKKKIRVEKSTFMRPDNHSQCFVYKCGNVVELLTSANRVDTIKRYRKRKNGEYIDLETGEIKKYSTKRTKRIENTQSLHSSFKQLRRIINTNIEGGDSEKFLTLTYGYPMTDIKQLDDDWRKLWKGLKYRYSNLGYIAVIEPQENENWHLHVFLKNMNGEKLYIPNDLLDKLWDKGFYKIESISPDSSDNMRCILYS